MNWKRTARWSWLILPFLLLAIWPGIAAAQLGVGPDANAVLYEVTENLKLKPLAAGRGLSSAALMGTVNAGTALCPASLAAFLGVPACGITAEASRNISLSTGTGPVDGKFQVVINTPATNLTDGPELVILEGTLSGKISLGLALLFGATSGGSGAPIGSITGRWNAHGVNGGPLAGVRLHGTFDGTFRLPFQPTAASPVLYAADTFFAPSSYGSPLGSCPVSICDVVPADTTAEFSLAVPTVRLEVEFVAE